MHEAQPNHINCARNFLRIKKSCVFHIYSLRSFLIKNFIMYFYTLFWTVMIPQEIIDIFHCHFSCTQTPLCVQMFEMVATFNSKSVKRCHWNNNNNKIKQKQNEQADNQKEKRKKQPKGQLLCN